VYSKASLNYFILLFLFFKLTIYILKISVILVLSNFILYNCLFNSIHFVICSRFQNHIDKLYNNNDSNNDNDNADDECWSMVRLIVDCNSH